MDAHLSGARRAKFIFQTARQSTRWLAASCLVGSALGATTPQIGGVIGDSTGQSGDWPLIEAPLGNPFEHEPTDAHTPLAGSATESKQLLGLALFWDEQVSSDNTVACATCHIPEVAGLDPRATGTATNQGQGSFGVMPQNSLLNFISGTPLGQQPQVTTIMAPTVLGAGFAKQLLWDASEGPEFSGSAVPAGQFSTNAALESVAVGPPLNTIEMSHFGRDFSDVVAKLQDSKILTLATQSTVPIRLQAIVANGMTYGDLCDIVFANDPNFGSSVASGVTRERFALAIATYIRTLVPNQAPIDTAPLSGAALAGFNLVNQHGCFQCHSDTNESGGSLPIALAPGGGFDDARDAMLTDHVLRPNFDLGFPEAPGASGQALGSFSVKTPSLRNVLLKPRFLHNGFFDDFDTLLDFYNGDLPALGMPTLGFGQTPFGFPPPPLTSSQKVQVKAFFESLTDPRLVPTSPGAQLPMPFSHPDLYADRLSPAVNEPANLPGTPASPSGDVPDIIAHVPALEGDVYFKVGMRNAPTLAPGRLAISPNPLPATQPAGPFVLNPSGLTVVNLVTDVDGFATYQETQPLMALAGQSLSFQWLVWDSSAGAWAYSNAAQVVVQ